MGDYPKGWQKALSKVEGAMAAIAALPVVVAKAYATTTFRARPIIDRHFTAGNTARYGWPELAQSTLLRRIGAATASNAQAAKKGWQETRADKGMSLFKGGTLPVLVETGALRNAIMTTAVIRRSGPESVIIQWTVPNYAHWHVDGGTKAGHPPKRDFRKPNQEDLADLHEIGQNFINQAIGEGTVDFTIEA